MSEQPTDAAPQKKGGKLGLALGLVGMLAGGGGAFWLMRSGLILGGGAAADDHIAEMPLQEVGFVALDAIVVPAGNDSGRHIKVVAQLEVAKGQEAEVGRLSPRLLDAFNTYLRAVEVSDLGDRSALPRLRAQMLRRAQILIGGDAVRDLLITEFILN